VNVAGPRSRDCLGRLAHVDSGNEGISYLDAKEALVAGVPCLILRIGFVGELGYELHFPSPYGEYLWDALLEYGADLGIRPFGLEPQRILRLEKMHILVGQDTDSESNVLEAGMPWIAKLDKDDFVGKWALEHVQERGFREQLVGFEMTDGVVPAEGGQIVLGGRPAGRVTSARLSPHLGRAIGWPGCARSSRAKAPRSRSGSTAGSRARVCGSSRSSTLKGSGSGRDEFAFLSPTGHAARTSSRLASRRRWHVCWPDDGSP